MRIIDTPFNTAYKLTCLASNGVGTVIRYYNFSNSSNLPEKRMDLAEAESLAAHGMQIVVIFQQRQNQLTDFSQAKGIAAGRQAYRYARDHIGQPAGSGIYFAVDFDASSEEIETAIAPYFEGVHRTFNEESGGNSEYRVGAYGSGLVCTTLATKGLIELVWLAMSRGFRGTKEALAAGEFHLAQKGPAEKLCGLGVDFNDANPGRGGFGAFTLQSSGPAQGVMSTSPQTPFSTVGERYRVIARKELRLREGPGTEFDLAGNLRPGQIVFVVSVRDDWARVDVEGDGQVDGFVSAGLLERI